jgi:hypothetical protein
MAALLEPSVAENQLRLALGQRITPRPDMEVRARENPIPREGLRRTDYVEFHVIHSEEGPAGCAAFGGLAPAGRAGCLQLRSLVWRLGGLVACQLTGSTATGRSRSPGWRSRPAKYGQCERLSWTARSSRVIRLRVGHGYGTRHKLGG